MTDRLFRISRNPIFLGIRLNFVGLFLVLPSAVTLAIWLLGDVAIQMQVFLEEKYLQEIHDSTYDHYRVTTSRYFGIPKTSIH